MDWAELRHWPGNLSVITPRRGGTEHGFFRPGGLWPRSTPRNFATEPATFYDAAIFTPNGVAFDAAFALVGFAGYVRIGPWAVAISTVFNGSIQLSFNISKTGSVSSLYPFGTSWITVPVGTVIAVHGAIYDDALHATLSFDGVIFRTNIVNASGAVASPVQGVTSANVTNLIANIKNSDGKIAWSYPSESERLRLTTNINAYANPMGYFEAPNPAVAARIDSQIDLRGKISDYTVAVDFEAAALTSTGQKQELAGQGAAIGQIPIAAIAYYRESTKYWLLITQEISGARTDHSVQLSSSLAGRHVACGRVSLDRVNNKTTLSISLDGALLSSGTYTGLPTGAAYSTYTNFAINDNRNGVYTNYFGKFYAAALFNRALPDAQINLMSH